FRLLQGVGGALIAANSGAVIADTFPPHTRGRAYGYNAIGWNVGAVLGVLLGGVLVTYVSWRWIFGINVPIGIAAYLVALMVLKDKGKRTPQRLDVPGMVTLGAGLFALLWAMTRLTSESFNASIGALLVLGAGLLVAFGVIENRRREPMLSLELFRIPTMTPSLLAAFFQSLANFAVLFLLFMYLQGVRGDSPIKASIVLVPGYVIGAFFGPIGGRIADRYGSVLPATVGLLIQIIALVMYAQLQVTTPIWVIVVAYIIGAIGAGGFYPANSAAVMRAAPSASFGIASGMLRTFANTGMVFSFALAVLAASQSITKAQAFALFVGTSTLSRSTGVVFSHAIHLAFYSSTVLMAVAAVLSALRARSGLRPIATPPSRGEFTGEVSA
ncbi:MAG: MFS transporter, partial [Acidimicrobiales bacterium]